MSTDLHDRTRQPSPEERPAQPERPKSALSIAQVVGGALAAMTAAALGSRLSVAGTVVGAAFASVIAAVAGSIYTSSLRRTSKHVSTVLARVRPATPGEPSAPAGPAVAQTTMTTTAGEDGGWTLPVEPTGPPAGTTSADRSRISWKGVVAGALLMFVIAALVLTGIELATGHALSGGAGTTVGQVAEPTTRPSPTPSRRPTPTPSGTPSATAPASAAPSATAPVVPSSAPSDEPSSEPTTSPSAEPSTTPVPSATPSAADSAGVATPAS
ncbi:MAG TPA: hypothetical protein VGC37_11670 [Friedmanniella sp.]